MGQTHEECNSYDHPTVFDRSNGRRLPYKALRSPNMIKAEFTVGQIRPIECVKEAFALIKNEYWVLLAVSLVGGMIAAISMYILIGAMVCGIFTCYLRKIDGGSVKFDDLFTGFKYFWSSLLVTVLVVVPLVA